MPTYQDIRGIRYWFDAEPDLSAIREGLTIAPDEDTARPEPVPPSLTPWQVRKGLNQRGLRSAVEATVAQQGQDTRDGWEFATEFLRDDPLLNAMATMLGIDLDEFFRFASTL